MSDLISRQDAIDVLHMDTSIIPYEKAREYVDATIEEIRNRLENLPSVQPEPCEDAVSRHRLLNDLKELIAAWEKYPVMAEQVRGVEAAIGYVQTIPSVQPEPERTMEEFIYGQDMGNPEDGSL